MSVVVRTEKVSKEYRLGVLNRRTFFADWRAKLLGAKPAAEAEANRFFALREVSFDVKDGDVLGILGRNGAGKSTLLKILSQITSPSAGRVLLKGRVASLLEVGTGFHQELTGRDNVYLNGTILGMTTREVAAKFDEILDFAGIGKFIDTPVKRYSSGMRVRLAFAVAAHLEPEILIIDEVLAVGDAAFQTKCIGKIGEVAGSGRTVLFVSHNPAAVETLCNRGIVLDQGRLIFDGSQTEAIALYAQLQQPAAQSLHDRTDREGTGQIRITSVELRDRAGQPIGSARAGEAIEVWMQFENHAPGDEFPHLSTRLSVRTELGAPVFTHLNDLTHTSFGALPAKGAFVCRLPRLPLPPSLYRIDYRISTSRRGGTTIDAISSACPLQVEPGPFFPNTDLPSSRVGVCLVDGEWRIEAGK